MLDIDIDVRCRRRR